MRNIMVIINPKSGSESGIRLKNMINQHLKNYFEEIVFKETHSPQDPVTFGKEAAENNFDSIMVVGGDGTLNGAITGFKDYDKRPKIAIVPAGTGNLMAKILGIPYLKRRAITAYKFEKTKKMNLGVCNDHVFNMFASLGPIPESIHEVSNEQKTALGFFAYVLNAMPKLVNSEIKNIKIETSNFSFSGSVDHLLVSLVNGIGPLRFSELDESIAKGEANIYIQKNKEFIHRFQTVTSAIGGKMENSSSMETFSSKKIIIDTTDDTKLDVDLDGELGPSLPVKITVLVDHNEFYLPEDNSLLNTQI